MKKIIALLLLPDTMMLAGAATLSYGAWLMYQPLGFIVGGTMTLAAGIMAARVTGKAKSE